MSETWKLPTPNEIAASYRADLAGYCRQQAVDWMRRAGHSQDILDSAAEGASKAARAEVEKNRELALAWSEFWMSLARLVEGRDD